MKPPDEREAAELGKRMRRRHAADFSLFQLERTYVRAPNHNEKARRGTGVRCFFQLFFLDSSVTREMIEASFMPGVAYAADPGSTELLQRNGWSVVLWHLVLSNKYATLSRAVNSKRYVLAPGNPGIVVKKCVSTFVTARHFSLERSVIGKQKRVKPLRGAARITGRRAQFVKSSRELISLAMGYGDGGRVIRSAPASSKGPVVRGPNYYDPAFASRLRRAA